MAISHPRPPMCSKLAGFGGRAVIAITKRSFVPDARRVPIDEIGKIRSVLTIMDGKIVYAGAPYASLAP